MAGKPITVTDETFAATVLASEQPVLIDFMAPWCAPCRAIAPVLEELATTYAGRATIAKVDTDENPGLMAEFGILGLPTIIVFKDGKPIERIQGARSKSVYAGRLDAVLDTARATTR